MKNNTKELRFGNAVITVSLAVLLAVLFTYIVLVYNNESSAVKAGEVMINQVKGVLEENRRSEEALVLSLKEEYIIRAKTVAYMLEHNADAEYSVEELSKIAELMSIDEIHLFDETGTIYSGTLPKYYGYSFDSGEQISFFKPMLADKSLSMCQDITPNTAEGKSMMYAIAWDSPGKRMIQVGIEPVRLLDELKDNSVSNVVDSMPIYDNLQIYVADADGNILGATDDSGGMELSSAGIDVSAAVPGVISHFHTVVNGRTIGCSVLKGDEYVICVVQDDASTKKETILSLIMVAAYLLLAAAALLIVIKRLLIIKKEQMDQLMILTSMAGIYYSMHLIDFKSNTLTEYAARNQVKEVAEKNSAEEPAETIRQIMYATMSDEYLEQGLLFTEYSTLPERLKGRKVIFKDLLGKNVGWIRMSFIAISADSEGVPEKVICTTQIIDEEKRKEESLIRESITDQLTRCYNRRAYEKDLHNYPDIPEDEDFVFVSMDVNGLKTVNDTSGHAAGDELLCGAAECMKRCFAGRGKVYRMGGDEFVAIIYASPDKLDMIKADFDTAVNGWSGEIVKSLSVSCGYVEKREFPEYTVTEMERLADERMYAAKAEYYEKLHACPR